MLTHNSIQEQIHSESFAIGALGLDKGRPQVDPSKSWFSFLNTVFSLLLEGPPFNWQKVE